MRLTSTSLLLSAAIASTLLLSACSSTMGPVAAGPLANTQQREANKKNAVDFYNQFFNQHDLTAAERYIGSSYTQHNPRVPNGREAFVQAFTAIFKQYPQRQSVIQRAIAEGDLVVLHVHSTNAPGERGSAIVDIFRFDAAGKIVEHWDVIQPIPETTASGNSMF